MIATDKCLDENALLGFFGGTISAAEVASIEEHVDGCADCRRLLAKMARTMVARASTSRVAISIAEPAVAVRDPSSCLTSGDLIGRYVVIKRIGAGGMVVVDENLGGGDERMAAATGDATLRAIKILPGSAQQTVRDVQRKTQ